MATVSDLAKLRIDRDAPPPAVKRALLRAVWLAAAGVGIVGAVALWLRGGSPTPVQVVTASLSEGDGGGGGAGPARAVAGAARPSASWRTATSWRAPRPLCP